MSGTLRIATWSASKGAKLQAPPLMAQATFKCDVETNFRLTLAGENGDPRKPIVLMDKSGAKMSVLPKLRSVDSNPVNLLFAALPESAYSGRAMAGKTYQVVVDLIPTETMVMKVSNQDQFSGNFQFYLN
ncbi:hypothetical protein [Undibacterium rugosum]|uniref:hypothetical protein n=1 Tax=Undibacterium rugosum TaxID=2762291 RepID=UPI001B833BFB|nr:hypothetical protein [Undibacterium rugosum]MBR7780223.1 hypothetical protein [Undibacterium rugosum]